MACDGKEAGLGVGGLASIPSRNWLQLGALSSLFFLITAATFASLGVVLPEMLGDLHWTWGQAALGFTLLGGFTGASSFIPAWLIPRIGVRGTLIGGSAVMACGFAGLATTHAVGTYWLGAALCGVGFQMMAVIPGTHVLATLFRHRAAAFGVYFTFGALGGVAGPLMVLAFSAAFPGAWRLYWLGMALAVAGLGALCAAAVGGRRWLAEAAAATDAIVAGEVVQYTNDRAYRTAEHWTLREAIATPQFWILLAAYFAHLLCAATVSAVSVAHLEELGVAAVVAAAMLSLDGLMQVVGRVGAGILGEYVEPKRLLAVGLIAQVAGLAALSVASTYPLMVIYAVGAGLGFGLTALAVTLLLLNYFGRRHNLQIFSLTCLVGAVSALGPGAAGLARDLTGSFGPMFQIFAGLIFLTFLAVMLTRPPIRSSSNEAHRRGPHVESRYQS